MGQPVVHFEVIGKDPEKLRSYYGDLFGWKFDTSAPVAKAVSQPGNYGFVNRNTTSDGTGIPVASVEARVITVMRSSTLASPMSKLRCRRLSDSAARARWAQKRTRKRISWWATSQTRRAT